MQPERSWAKTTLFASASNVSMGWLLKMPQATPRATRPGQFSANKQEGRHA
jgi:hypothetical protein